MVYKIKNILSFFQDYKKNIVYILTFIILYGTLATALITKKYDLKEGDIPNMDIKAQREIIDESATKTRKEDAKRAVSKQYSKKEIEKQNEDSVKAFFSKVEEVIISTGTSEEKLKALLEFNTFKLSNEELTTLITLSGESANEVENILLKAIKKAYESPIEEDKKDDLEEARKRAIESIESSKENSDIRNISNKILLILIQPNFFYDKEKTDEAINEALKKVAPVVFKKNQIIVKEGEPVTAHQMELLGELGLLNNSKFNSYIYVALAVLVMIVMYLQYGYLRKHYKNIYDDLSKLIMISLINIMSVVFARVFSAISPYLIPLACTPILLTLLLNYKVSLALCSMNIILIAGAVGFNPNIIILSVISVILGATSLRKVQQRNDILYSTIAIAILNGMICLCIAVLVTNNYEEILLDSIFTIGGALLSGVLAIGLLPFFESTFDIVTTVKLLELSNPNHPLQKKLLMEAPGTYHHSILVANLAELATEEVGGNPLLARIGAYYHDIGKTKRPYFFRENQIRKENPHDKISPSLSTLIIISHVKDGLSLAKEYNVPKVIQNFIATHHGDTLVKYFYLTVKNNSSNPESVKEEDFRYPGPKPETKEQGILMLADSVEAAVRSINDPTKEKIEEMVNNIVKDKLYSEQLDRCDLTLKDIDKIKKCFLKALNGIYHERIEYPVEHEKKEK